MKRSGLLCALLAGALLAGQAQAQDAGQGYIGIGYGVNYSDGASPNSNTIDEGRSGGIRVFGGKMYSNIGMEFGYYDLGKYDVNLLGVKVDEMKTQAITVMGVYAVPIGTSYTFQGKAGVAFTQAQYACIAQCGTGTTQLLDTRKRDVGGVIGFGVTAKFAQNVLLRADYEHIGSVKHARATPTTTTEWEDAYDVFSISLVLAF
jgi:hypothetical protein